jgi:hypothetical protein
MKSQVQILRLFFMLEEESKSQYQVAQIVNLLQLVSLQQRGSPVFDMITNHPELINEERGEISFAVLARRSTGSAVRQKVEHLSKMYVSTKAGNGDCKQVGHACRP